jgi:hypothetical protein
MPSIVYRFAGETDIDPVQGVSSICDNIDVLYDKYDVNIDVDVVVSGVNLAWSYVMSGPAGISAKVKMLSSAKLFTNVFVDDFKVVLRLLPKKLDGTDDTSHVTTSMWLD